ncbi:DUF418 domain-containing protein [Rheinheimera gaetbuli]
MSNQRSFEVDVIRMVALIGIGIVNVPFMAIPVTEMFSTPQSSWDQLATVFVEAFFLLKFFLLFSFIFGWGMAIQMQQAATKGFSFTQRYRRRMVGLLLLGVLHATLVFSGDILVLYALFGSLLWCLKEADSKKLLKIAMWMLPLSVVCLSAMVIVLAVALEGEIPAPAYSLGGNYAETVLSRLDDWPVTFFALIFVQGPLVFAAFSSGFAAGKSHFFQPGHKAFTQLEHAIPWLLVLGLPLNILFALVVRGYLQTDWLQFLGFIGIGLGAPMLSAVYLYLLVRLARRLTHIPNILLLAGRNSLSSYMLQGVLAGFVFAGYGLGWFGQFGQFALLGVAIIIALTAMLLVGLYAQFFGRGPMEVVLRKISGV